MSHVYRLPVSDSLDISPRSVDNGLLLFCRVCGDWKDSDDCGCKFGKSWKFAPCCSLLASLNFQILAFSAHSRWKHVFNAPVKFSSNWPLDKLGRPVTYCKRCGDLQSECTDICYSAQSTILNVCFIEWFIFLLLWFSFASTFHDKHTEREEYNRMPAMETVVNKPWFILSFWK